MMSAGAGRERHEQFEHDRTVLDMRAAVLAAVAPAFVARMGSSAVSEAVDEALAQLVAAGGHRADPDAVRALWITCARRRLIDEQRSAEARHRAVAAGDDAVAALADRVCGEPSRLTDDERQSWRIREILGVLRGDQRVWAEAWYDRVLSASRVAGGQPRGLAEALGWTPAKTKSVSRRARMRMAAFIEARVSGVVCEEQRVLMDDLIIARGRGRGGEVGDPRHDAVLVHVAGCDACWAAWHARRRTLLGRVRMAVGVPIDGLAIAAHIFGLKLAGIGVAAHTQSHALGARVGVGGAAAAGGGAATIGGKATAVCVGVVCAATAGGELAGVLPPIVADRPQEVRRSAPPQKRPVKPAPSSKPAAGHAPTAAAKLAPAVRQPAVTDQLKAAVTRSSKVASQKPVARATPGDLPGTGSDPIGGSSTATGQPAPAASNGTSAAPSSTFSPTGSASGTAPPPPPPPPPPAAREAAGTTCAPGSLGC